MYGNLLLSRYHEPTALALAQPALDLCLFLALGSMLNGLHTARNCFDHTIVAAMVPVNVSILTLSSCFIELRCYLLW